MVETSNSSPLGCCAELRRCTEVNGLGGVEKGIGFQVNTGEGICSNIVRFLDVADIGCEMGDIV